MLNKSQNDTIEKFSRSQLFGSVTYAQHGDDLMLLNLFHLLKIKSPTYLDLGAHHPYRLSNTALLYERGSRGVNVEANPYLIEDFKKYRPEDKNLNVGVGLEVGNSTFFMYDKKSGRNTFSFDEVKTLDNIMTVKESAQLPMLTLMDIVDGTCGGAWPDLLLCDIEGLDFDVLNSADFKNHSPPYFQGPKIVCVETRLHDTNRMRLMMELKLYALHCRMGENLFFIRTDLKDLVY